MSQTKTVGVSLRRTPDIERLLADIEAAHRWAAKSEPGERTEIASFEALCASLEVTAGAALLADPQAQAPPPDRAAATAGLFIRGGSTVTVALHLPLEPGELIRSGAAVAAPEPASVVEIRDDLCGRRLVEARFREQLEAALADPGRDRSSALSPSGVHNRVLTEVLRQYVDRRGQAPVTVPVVYRDGSQATAGFPFRCLDLTARLRDQADLDLELRLTLLSIRHTEMDPVVDGAWLRNAEVSRPRPAAQTDDFAYHASASQLDSLTSEGARKVRLHIFQTGLETAVVGFYRAVTEFLVRHPGSLEVVPMFYAARPPHGADAVADDYAGFEAGEPWAAARGTATRGIRL
jgi:hypothetical protein